MVFSRAAAARTAVSRPWRAPMVPACITTQRSSRRTSPRAADPAGAGRKIRSSVQLSTTGTRSASTPVATTASRREGALTAIVLADR